MNDEELIELWQSQPDSPQVDEDAVIKALRDAHRCEDRRMLYLNVQEAVPSVFLFLIFGWCGLTFATGKWAFVAAAFLCLGIGLFLVWSTIRQRKRESRFGDTVKEQVRKSLSQVKHREWLFANILWWYLLPAVLGWGAVVYVVGIKDGVSMIELSYVIVCLAFFVWVFRLNRRAAAERYTPRRLRLEEVLGRIESGAEIDSGAE